VLVSLPTPIRCGRRSYHTGVSDESSVPLSARIGARAVDPAFHEGVPDWLVRPLLDWLGWALNKRTVYLVAARMRISLLASSDPPSMLRHVLGQRAGLGFGDGRWDLLDAIDHLVQMDWDELKLPDIVNDEALPGSDKLSGLERILAEGGSAYHVSIPHQRLERRVDETAADAVERSAAVSGDEAGRYLRHAWTATYGLHPDPTTAYREAVRAVEAAACPLVLPNDPKPTLGKAIAHLKQTSNNWALAIAGDGAAGVAPLVAMLELLWTGQVSRHAGASTSRDQRQIEAEAAVALAATLVHWFAIGVVRRQN
jgi:hypothetical protein